MAASRGAGTRGGDAPIKQQGHTANGKFGSGPSNKAVSRPEPSDLTKG